MKTMRQHQEFIAVSGEPYRCLFYREPAGYRVTCPTVPPMIAVGRTPDEARLSACEELEGWLEAAAKNEVVQSASPGAGGLGAPQRLG